jgi:hypothetical protein
LDFADEVVLPFVANCLTDDNLLKSPKQHAARSPVGSGFISYPPLTMDVRAYICTFLKEKARATDGHTTQFCEAETATSCDQ